AKIFETHHSCRMIADLLARLHGDVLARRRQSSPSPPTRRGQPRARPRLKQRAFRQPPAPRPTISPRSGFSVTARCDSRAATSHRSIGEPSAPVAYLRAFATALVIASWRRNERIATATLARRR